MSETVRCLLCRSGPVVVALPLEQVAEIMRPLPVLSLAAAPACVLGAAIIRGVPTPVVDLTVLLGAAHDPHATRFVRLSLGEHGARSVALRVSSVEGVRSLPRAQLAPLPPLLRDLEHRQRLMLSALDQELCMLLEASHLLPDGLWDELGALEQARG